MTTAGANKKKTDQKRGHGGPIPDWCGGGDCAECGFFLFGVFGCCRIWVGSDVDSACMATSSKMLALEASQKNGGCRTRR